MPEIDYINGLNLGIGFNSASLTTHPVPALEDVLSTRPVINAGGQEVTFRVEVASNTLDLAKQLDVSGRVSLRFGAFGSGSAKSQFFESVRQNSFSLYVFVQVVVTNKQELLDLTTSRLKSDAATLYANSPGDFIQQYGDSFVYGLITGGEFIGIMELETNSSEELRQAKASIGGKATFGFFGGNASGAFSESLNKITSSYAMKGYVFRQGAAGAMTGVSPDELISEALNFPAKVNGPDGFLYRALIIPYNHIPHPTASPLDTANQLSALERLGSLRQRIIKYQNDIDFALANISMFEGLDVRVANERSNGLSRELDKIMNSARRCFNNSQGCRFPNIDLALLENIIPDQSGTSAFKNMISGKVDKYYWQTPHPFFTGNPTGEREDIIRVDFPSGSFASPPTVETMISALDNECTANLRVRLTPENVSINGFDLKVSIWGDSRLYGFAATWFAY